MNKLVLEQDSDIKIIAFTLSKSMRIMLRDILKNSPSYNLKKKSKWINEAILALKDNINYEDLVNNAESTGEDTVFDKVYMTFKQRCILSEMRSAVVQKYPDIKGPQGAVIRAAIFSRIMRKR